MHKSPYSKYLLLVTTIILTKFLCAQHVSLSSVTFADTLKPVNSIPMFGDSLAKSFIIDIRKEIKLHKHETHSEHVYIVNGQAMMTLGTKVFPVQPGDLIFIPKGTPHKVVVIGPTTLRVISIQAPDFDGKDRIFLE